MNQSRHPRFRAAWISAAGAVSLLAFLITLWLTPAADAKVGGYAEVTRLEIKYIPDHAVLDARFHLASGIALTQRFKDETTIDRLFATADTFAQKGTRLFVSAEDDTVISWNLSIP